MILVSFQGADQRSWLSNDCDSNHFQWFMESGGLLILTQTQIYNKVLDKLVCAVVCKIEERG